MIEYSATGPGRAYRRQAVDEYLRQVADQKVALEAAIAHGRTRLERAAQLERRVAGLEQHAGGGVVGSLTGPGRHGSQASLGPGLHWPGPSDGTIPGSPRASVEGRLTHLQGCLEQLRSELGGLARPVPSEASAHG